MLRDLLHRLGSVGDLRGYSLVFDGDGAWLGGLHEAFLAHLDPVRPGWMGSGCSG